MQSKTIEDFDFKIKKEFKNKKTGYHAFLYSWSGKYIKFIKDDENSKWKTILTRIYFFPRKYDFKNKYEMWSIIENTRKLISKRYESDN